MLPTPNGQRKAHHHSELITIFIIAHSSATAYSNYSKGADFLLFYYFIVLLISIIKRKNFKNSLIKFLSIVFLIIFSAFIAHIWNEEIKKKTVIYYNNSNLTKGYEEEKISAYNMSRQVKLYFENNKKVAAVYLFNFRKFTYDNENKWKEID